MRTTAPIAVIALVLAAVAIADDAPGEVYWDFVQVEPYFDGAFNAARTVKRGGAAADTAGIQQPMHP